MSTVKDLVHKLGWDAMLSLQAAGVQPSYLSHVFYVDANNPNALDANDGVHGESWENPYATVDYAFTRSNATLDWSPDQGDWWGQNNYILIGPAEYEEDVDTCPYGATVIGCGPSIYGGGTEGCPRIKAATASAFAVASMIATTFINITFETSVSSGVSVDVGTMNHSAFINCRFHTNVADLTTHLEITDMTRSYVRGCTFSSGTTHAGYGINVGADSGTTMFGSVIENCVINAATAGVIVDSTVTLSGGGTWIRGNDISNPTKGIDLNNSTSNLINVAHNHIIASSDAIEGATAALVIGNWVNENGTADWEADEAD